MKNVTDKLNLTIVNKSANSIKAQFKNKIQSYNSPSVIYQVPCNSCNKSYIGETSDFERRVKEHRYSLRTADLNNAIVKHVFENNHSVNFNNTRIVHKENDIHKRKLIEALIIKNSCNFNIHRTNYDFDSISNTLLIKEKKIKKLLNEVNSTNDAET